MKNIALYGTLIIHMLTASGCLYTGLRPLEPVEEVAARPPLNPNDDVEMPQDARTAGERDAKARESEKSWFLLAFAGSAFGGGCVGLIPVYMATYKEPYPPAEAFVGKSPEYVAAYTEAYKVTAVKIREKAAWAGCLCGLSVGYALLVVAFAIAEGSSY